MTVLQHSPGIVERGASLESDQPGAHHLSNEKDLQWIHAVLPTEMKATSCHFLGQDRTLQHQDGECVGNNGGNQKGKNHVDIMRQFHREYDSGEWRPHGAAEDCSHAD